MSVLLEQQKKALGFSEIKKWLRHKHPVIYLDRVIDYGPGVYLTAILAISGNMDCMAGHFPERAIFPGTHLLQSFSQAGILLFQLSTRLLQEDEVTVVGAINGRFFAPIVPGDQVNIHLSVEKLYQDIIFFNGEACVNGKRVAAMKANIKRVAVTQFTEVAW